MTEKENSKFQSWWWLQNSWFHRSGCCLCLAWYRNYIHSLLGCSVAKMCPTLCDPMDKLLYPPLSLLRLMSIELVMLSNHLILCRPLHLLPSIFPSIRVFSNESALRISRPNYWSFSFSISPFNEYSGWISFRIDWFGLLALQGTLKSLFQHHILKALSLTEAMGLRSSERQKQTKLVSLKLTDWIKIHPVFR